MKIKRPSFWYFLFHPSFWVKNHPTSESLSNFIIKSLENGYLPEVVDGDTYRLKLRGIKMWAENYPYAYGTIIEANHHIPSESKLGCLMPSRVAIKMLRDAEMYVRKNPPELRIKKYLDMNMSDV